jgi:hypothetical protein
VRRLSTLLAAAALLAGCGGDDEPAATATQAETAPAPAATEPTPTVNPEAQPQEAPPPTIRLDAPSDGDQYLEGSTDSRADFKCRNAETCEATAQRDGGDAVRVEDGGKLPTDAGTYTFVVTARGPGGDAEQSAAYEVPDLPGDGGSGKDTKPPPNLPEAGP